MVDADEALRIGLCDRVVEPEAVLAEAEALLRTILAMGPLAVRQVIEAVDAGFTAGIDDALDGEAVRFGLLAGSEDMREGMAAFLAKRPAEFRGR
jgi:enoyl-CoA hydratase